MIDLSHVNSMWLCLGATAISVILLFFIELRYYIKYKHFYWQEVVYHSLLVFAIMLLMMYVIFPNIK